MGVEIKIEDGGFGLLYFSILGALFFLYHPFQCLIANVYKNIHSHSTRQDNEIERDEATTFMPNSLTVLCISQYVKKKRACFLLYLGGLQGVVN